MFLGHYGVGLASKKIEPRASLGTYAMAAVFLDLLWPVFLLLGLEHVKIDPGNTVVTPLNFYDYPYSHSMLMSVVWSLLFGGIYYLIKKIRKPPLFWVFASSATGFLISLCTGQIFLWPRELKHFSVWVCGTLCLQH